MSVYRPTYTDKKTGKTKQARVWWFHFTFAGRHVQESSKSTRKTVAVEAEKKRRLELERVYNGVPTAKPQQWIRTVAVALKEYQTTYAINHRPKAVSTVEERSPHLVRILGSTILSDLTENRMAEYMAQRLDEAMKAAKARAKAAEVELDLDDLVNLGHRTVNMEIDCLARALGFQWRMLWPKLKRLEEPKDVGRALEPKEEQALLEAAAANRRSPMALPFIRIALSTGMRFSEIRGLKWARIDLGQRALRVGQSKTAAGTGRGLAMNDGLYRTLLEHSFWWEKKVGRPPAQDDFVFPFSKRWGPLDPRKSVLGIKSAWESIREKAGVDCRFHDLRHTAYSKLDAAEVPEQVIMAVMGHVSKAMRERYSHARMDAMRDAMKHLELDKPVGPAKESAKVTASGESTKPLTN